VKYLRELRHQNVIEVSFFLEQLLPFIILDPSPQLLDVFSSKTNLNLVLEFLDSDLEMIIKDRSLVFLPADIKSWMAMTFRGLEFCHRNWILHRVVTFFLLFCPNPTCSDNPFSGPKTQ
jgi:Serine/threonine protein kinase